MTISIERSIPWRNAEDSPLSFRSELVLEVLSGGSSQAEVCRRHNLNENQLSQWKRHLKEYRQSLISEAVTGKIDVRDEV